MNQLGIIALAILCTVASASAENDPNAQAFDFGACWPGATVHHVFIFHNASASAWKVVGVDARCSCTVPGAIATDTAAGQDLRIPIDFTVVTKRDAASMSSVVVHIVEAQGAKRDLVCSVSATAASTLSIPEPRMVLDPIPMPSGPRHETIHLKRGANPAPWDRLVASVTDGATVLAAEAREVSADAWDVELTVTPGAWMGVVPARVLLTCYAGKAALPFVEQVSVAIRFAGAVHAEPSSALLGAIPLGESRSACVAICGQDGAPCAATAVQAADARCSATLAANGQLTITLHGAKPTGSASGWVDVTTPAGILRVPYFAAIINSFANGAP